MTHPIFADLWQGKEAIQDQPALLCGDHTWSFRQFFDQILRAEAGLRALGVRAGELVTILSMNTPETIAAFYAVDRIGAVANWVDMKLSPKEVEGYLTQADSRVVLALEVAFAKVYQNRGQAPAKHFVCLPLGSYVPEKLRQKLRVGSWEEHRGPGCLSWEEFLQDPDGAEPDWLRWEEPAAIVYTGGTTGPAKGVMLSRRAFRVSLEQYTQAETEYGPGGANLTLLPPFAAFGLCQCIHVPLCLGMAVILAPLFRPDQLGELLMRYRPEQVSGTTSYWQLLLKSPAVQEADLSFLKNPRCGGDAMSPELEKRINRFLAQRGCPAPLVQEYGMSEVCGIICVSYGPWRREGTVGHPVPGCRIVAADPDGRQLPPGEQGELLIRSGTVMNGYYGHPEADGQVLRPGPDGQLWVWTKDLGYVEPDGSVVVTGRIKRMISRNGFKIFPSVIENCLLQSPLVEVCAVVACQSPGGETLPVAHVVLSGETTPEEAEPVLRALCKRELNTYLFPAAYFFRPALPLTRRGKLDYRTLEQESHLT